MNDYKPQLKTLLFDLKNKPHCLLEKKALELEAMLEAYISGEISLPEDKEDEEEEEEAVTANGIAIININGIICKRVGLPQEILEFFGLCDLDYVDAQLKAVMTDETITACILNVCSPGGYIGGVQSTANLIGKLSEVKETVVYSDLLNASAAYWLSSQASSIIVSEDAELGSIGVYTQVMDYSKMLENDGVKIHLIKAGKFKAIGDPTQPLTDEAKAYLQDGVNQTWEAFKGAVNTKRTVDEEDMQGQTFSGKSLLDKGLVDGFAVSIEEVILALSNN